MVRPAGFFYSPKQGRWSMKMQEKASLAAYLSSGFLVLVGKVGKWFNDLTLNDWAIVIWLSAISWYSRLLRG